MAAIVPIRSVSCMRSIPIPCSTHWIRSSETCRSQFGRTRASGASRETRSVSRISVASVSSWPRQYRPISRAISGVIVTPWISVVVDRRVSADGANSIRPIASPSVRSATFTRRNPPSGFRRITRWSGVRSANMPLAVVTRHIVVALRRDIEVIGTNPVGVSTRYPAPSARSQPAPCANAKSPKIAPTVPNVRVVSGFCTITTVSFAMQNGRVPKYSRS